MSTMVAARVTYVPRKGFSLSQDEAVTIGESLNRLTDRTADKVVEAATPDDNPLHPYFEWDDGIAGPKYRLIQARRLLNSIEVHIIKADKTEIIGPAFVALPLEDDGSIDPDHVDPRRPHHYVTLEEVRARPEDLGEAVIRMAYNDLAAFHQRYLTRRTALPEFEKRYGRIMDLIAALPEPNGKHTSQP